MKYWLWGNSMLEDLEIRRKGLIAGMVIAPIVLLIVMLVFILKVPQLWWAYLLIFLVGCVLIMFTSFVRMNYIDMRIKELKELEESKNAQTNVK